MHFRRVLSRRMSRLKTLNKLTAKKILIGYWIIGSLAFYLYLAIFQLVYKTSFSSLLVDTPNLTLGFLCASLVFCQLLLMIRVTSYSKSRKGNAGKFFLFVIIQQIVTMNPIGAILGYRCYQRLSVETEEKCSDWFLWLSIGFIGTVSVVCLLLVFINNIQS